MRGEKNAAYSFCLRYNDSSAIDRRVKLTRATTANNILLIFTKYCWLPKNRKSRNSYAWSKFVVVSKKLFLLFSQHMSSHFDGFLALRSRWIRVDTKEKVKVKGNKYFSRISSKTLLHNKNSCEVQSVSKLRAKPLKLRAFGNHSFVYYVRETEKSLLQL